METCRHPYPVSVASIVFLPSRQSRQPFVVRGRSRAVAQPTMAYGAVEAPRGAAHRPLLRMLGFFGLSVAGVQSDWP